MFTIEGKLKRISETQQVTDSFKKREFVITQDSGPYPQYISFQLVQDNCGLIDGMQEGDEVKINFDVRGREWTAPDGQVKYFNSLNAWRMEKVGGGADQPPLPEVAPPPAEEPALPEEEDDLPF
ncbi:MAG: DUF3127 domain-containing protein [Flavobacteriales bacterium]|nr:DUF3127 domain-containing protein [Flavobacteriales bacterium]